MNGTRDATRPAGPLLSVAGLSKKFARASRRGLSYGVRDIARELFPVRAPRAELRAGEFWALHEVSLQVARGEALAVVGDNGAGKSTLLKVLCGLLKPDAGDVRLRGRVGALIELGAGFHPLLTGRENVRLGAALYGLRPRERAELEERAIDFAELGEFIDTPVQAYSSGMRARLGFALAAQLSPALMLVDEVLAVGDQAFQRKCALHMRAYLDRGGALLFVSHNIHQIQSLCDRGLLLERGRAVFQGSAVDTLDRMFARRKERPVAAAEALGAPGPVHIQSAGAESLTGGTVEAGRPARIRVGYRCEEPSEVVWGFSIWTADQWVCVAGEQAPAPRTLPRGEGELTCVIPALPLVAGRYALRIGVLDARTLQPLALRGWRDVPAVLEVRSEASQTANSQRSQHQLITLPVQWG